MIKPTLEQRVEFLEATAIANLRDFFATSALSFLADGKGESTTFRAIAIKAYHIADAMLVERSKGGTKNPQ